ncbi:MAG: cytochrome c oxidase subunit II [Chloroflexi bacterium]|nr:cytochrome c oxidase subunit II [Chloroflexota bacterium]
MQHFARATVIGLALGAVLALSFFVIDITPPRASWEALELDLLFKTYLAIMSIVFSLVLVFLVYSVLVFRRRHAEERGAPFRSNALLERGWLIVTTVLVLVAALDAAIVLDKVFSPRTGYAQPELEVKVTASQWAWQFEYPQYGVRTAQPVLEQQRPVLFRLTSRDVVHSLFVPEFRMKFDALPGMETRMRVVPTALGQFKAVCAEACGLAHTFMAAPVRVVTPDEFQRWLAEQRR